MPAAIGSRKGEKKTEHWRLADVANKSICTGQRRLIVKNLRVKGPFCMRELVRTREGVR